MKQKNFRLALELLEDRIQPSTLGMPWPYANLTVSFAPDGTLVDGYQSSLSKTLGSQTSTQAWQTQLLRAVQTWADAGNINVGVVADGGQALGTNGLIQGDTRFGDIRFAAEPMGLGAPLAIGSPYNPLAGTRSGDVVFNSSYSFGIGGANGYDINSVALHELGHVFGLGDNTDPTSVMFGTYQGAVSGPSGADLAAFQSLYGTRMPDAYEGPNGNNTLSTPAVMKLPEIAADISTVGQADYFQYTTPSYADRTITLTVQNGGVSLLMPRLTVFTTAGIQVATSSAASVLSNTVSITLNNVKRGTTLVLKVDSANTDVFGMGGYRLKVDSGAVSRLQIAAIDAALNANMIVYHNFGHSTSTPATAVALDAPIYKIDPRFTYAVDAKLNDASDVDFFSITTPATAPEAIVFTAAPGQGSQLSPNLTVYDANGNVVDAEILSNEASGYVVQLMNPVAGAKYYVAVSGNPFAASINDMGTYRLGVNYTSAPVVLETLVDDTLSATDMVDVVSLQSTEVQLYHFVFSVDTAGVVPGVEVLMQLFDSNNNLVLSLLCHDGETVSADVQLKVGVYTARFIGYDSTGAILPLTAYSLLGISLSNPLDPLPVNPTTSSPGTTTPTTSTTDTSSTVLLTTPITPPVLPPPPTL
jgi:hypothetical protein